MRNYIFLGPPGAGKGSLAKLLSAKLGIPHISTGDLFRRNIADRTDLGLLAAEYIQRGHLVPDEVTNSMVEKRLLQADCSNGFILDGYPRNTEQADVLQRILSERKISLTAVILLKVEEELIVHRLSGRRVCVSCGASYNLNGRMPGNQSICDSCGGHVVQREDDKEETVRARFHTYKEKTSPLVQYYDQRNLLLTTQNQGTVEEAFADLCKLLEIG